MIMSCCWEYVCVRLDKMHAKDWIKWGNYVSAMKSKTRNDLKVADDYWIDSDIDCVDDFYISSNSVFVNDFCINSGTCALMNSMSAANQFLLPNYIVSSESVFLSLIKRTESWLLETNPIDETITENVWNQAWGAFLSLETYPKSCETPGGGAI